MRVVLTIAQEGDQCKIVLVEPQEGNLLLILQALQAATSTVVNQLVEINALPVERPLDD